MEAEGRTNCQTVRVKGDGGQAGLAQHDGEFAMGTIATLDLDQGHVVLPRECLALQALWSASIGLHDERLVAPQMFIRMFLSHRTS